MSKRATIATCLGVLGVLTDDLACYSDVEEQFKVIRKAYLRKVLQCHPDKGGDEAIFRDQNTSFEVLRDLFESKKAKNFAMNTDSSQSEEYAEKANSFQKREYAYYAHAAEEDVPAYRVEPAKSDRSSCKFKNCEIAQIAKGELRCGSVDAQSGTYGRWMHLSCWRVPHKVWVGLPAKEAADEAWLLSVAAMNSVVLAGFTDLTVQQQLTFIQYLRAENWAKATKKTGGAKGTSLASSSASSYSSDVVESPSSSSSVLVSSSSSLVAAKPWFEIPEPNGINDDVLRGKTVVLTGTFPEVGGGTGLNLGKDRVGKLVAKFGGKVTTSVSGNTDILVVGEAPGMKKVGEARSKPRCTMISVHDLKTIIEENNSDLILLDDSGRPRPPLIVQNFSSGYMKYGGPNGLQFRATPKELDIARGLEPGAMPIRKPAPPAKAKKAPRAAPSKEKKKKAERKKASPKGQAKETNTKKHKRVVSVSSALAFPAGAAKPKVPSRAKAAKDAKKGKKGNRTSRRLVKAAPDYFC